MTNCEKQKVIGVVKELANETVEMMCDTPVRVEYRLMNAEYSESVYFISVSTADERSTVLAGNDEAEANGIFDLLVKGVVTPCTAEDVVSDVRNSVSK